MKNIGGWERTIPDPEFPASVAIYGASVYGRKVPVKNLLNVTESKVRFARETGP